MAQDAQTFTIAWEDALQRFETDEKTMQRPTFTGALHLYENDFLPLYTGRVQLPPGVAVTGAAVQVLSTAAVPGHHAQALRQAGGLAVPEFHWEQKTERGRDWLVFSWYPVASGPSEVQAVTSFRVSVQTQKSAPRPKMHTFASASRFATGDWYKVGVTEDGLYRIDRSFLASLGVPVSGLNPAAINVYGNGFGQLPFQNSISRPDDILVNPIEIVGEADGSFDQSDFILFYARGPHRWTYNEAAGLYNHSRHDYCDTSYYFIGINTGDAPVRVSTFSPSGQAPNYESVAFNDYTFHERERENLIKSGRRWFGEKFDVQTTYTFSGAQFTFPNPEPGSEAVVRASAVGRNTISGITRFTLNANGTQNQVNVQNTGTGVTASFATPANLEVRLPFLSPSFNISVSYDKSSNPAAAGWLDWLNVNVRRRLRMVGNQLIFRDALSAGLGRVTRFTIANASLVGEVWEVTSPESVRRIQLTRNGDEASFVLPTPTIREFVAFSGSGFPAPTPFGKVANQNLHAMGQDGVPDMVIVAPRQFMARAEELAALHRNFEPDPLTVEVVPLGSIYNEFSSGMRDVTAIKWFMKMLYDRGGGGKGSPRYLVLFGDGSYDNRNATPGNTNFIPTYQSFNSLEPANSFVSDDYYAFMDDNEGEGNLDQMDFAVGRLVVKSNQEATSVINKIRRYMEIKVQEFTAGCTVCNTQGSNVGPWRNMITLVADDEDGNDHMIKSNQVSNQINGYTRRYNLERIFIDAFPQVATPGGARYPAVNEAINRRVRSGAFIINYIGHGGELGWAQERILDIPTILAWDNSFAMPVFMTATCEFTRFDDPLRTSAGEFVLLNGNGGGIALMTTTRLVFSGPNFTLNQRFYDALFNRPPGEKVTRLGDVSRECKNLAVSGFSSNHRNFSLVGDPGLPLAIPRHEAVITAITDTLDQPVDTLKALAVVRVRGEIIRDDGSFFSNFNGRLSATVYDREKNRVTLANDGGGTFQFRTQEDVIYRGIAEVVNGTFQFEFVLPRDISFAVDSTARISLYAFNETEDASGYRNSLRIGDRDPNAVDSGVGPRLQLFMNDENFVNGGFTSDTPILLSKIFDESGINTVGTGIGHDITATIEGDSRKVLVLNDFYESDLNTYQSGKIIYPIEKLNPGHHELALKVWNVHNRSTEEKLEFVVASSEKFAIERVLNYPNPFTTFTEFYFEHNQSCAFLNVQVDVYTVSGRLVKSIVTVSNTDGFRNEPIPWNGRDDFGDRLATGVYLYKVTVRNPAGEKVTKFEKLVILN